MGAITDGLAEAFRDFATAELPASGAHEPIKSEIRAIGPIIESAIANVGLAALVDVVKDTRANLNADLAHLANTIALVYADGTDANNDLYIKVGGSGSGSWTLTSIFHDVIEAQLAAYLAAATIACTVGGTANAITLTPETAVTDADQRLRGVVGGTNAAGGTTIAATGVFGGAATTVILPGGEALPAAALVVGYPFTVAQAVISGNNRFILVDPTFVRQPTVMRLIHMATVGTAITAKLASPAVPMPSDLSNITFELTMPASKAVGGHSIEIYKNDGTTLLLAASPLRDQNDGVIAGENYWVANDTLRFVRNASTGRLEMVSAPDRVTPTITDMVRRQVTPSAPLSTSRPLRVLKVSATLYWVDVRLHADHYRDGNPRKQSDFARFVMKDTGPTHSMDSFFILNSVWAFRSGIWVQLSNFEYDGLVGGITTETGLVASTFEPVLKLGRFGVDADGDYVLAGPNHSHLNVVAATITETLNDISTSNIDVVTNSLEAAPVGTMFTGDKVVFGSVLNYEVPSGENACEVTFAHTFESASAYQLRLQTTADFNEADGSITPGVRDGSYAWMNPTTDVDRVQGVLSGVAGSLQSMGDRDGGNHAIGNSDKIVSWDSLVPKVRGEVVLGFGAPYKIDGVDGAYATGAPFALDNDYGPKEYGEIFSATPVTMASKVLTFDTRYRAVIADGVV